MDFGPPTTGPNGGEIVPIKRITDIYPNICSSPTNVECRAKLFPTLPLSEIGQDVICNAQNGLICLNQNQGLQQQCFDYEIRVLCCETNCPTSGTSPTTITTATNTQSSSKTTSTTTSTTTTKSPATSSITTTATMSTSSPTTAIKTPLPTSSTTMLSSPKTSTTSTTKPTPPETTVITTTATQTTSSPTTTKKTPLPTSSTSTTTTTTAPLPTPTPTRERCTKSCIWSDWMDFGPPTTGPNGGEIVPIKRITDIYPNICSSPTNVECRAKLFPTLPLSEIGQDVVCNAQNGLICLNQNQGLQQQCFDYEIRK
ncbi:mucin-2-like [Electrophorus electricus]|uniref:mucin-2-like n=1 Tax=Electrophorus electricus TaxID=8005 RepID=UPI0015CFDDF1|nr:mucin-2-like [Electrophorus electricus]